MTYEQILNTIDLNPGRALEYERDGLYAYAKIINEKGVMSWRVRSLWYGQWDYELERFSSLIELKYYIKQLLNL